MLRVLQRKLIRALRREGLRGTAQIGLRKLRQAVGGLSPSTRRARRARQEAEFAFDAKYNVETAGVISLAEFELESGNWEHGCRYQPIDPGEFHEMMRAAGAVARDRVFVDFGCGKGRALFLASDVSL